jgi:hypothetical protein
MSMMLIMQMHLITNLGSQHRTNANEGEKFKLAKSLDLLLMRVKTRLSELSFLCVRLP